MVNAFFRLLRVLVGLLGAYWLAGGLWGFGQTTLDHAWGASLVALMIALLGVCVVHAAFVRAPWEARVKPRHRAQQRRAV